MLRRWSSGRASGDAVDLLFSLILDVSKNVLFLGVLNLLFGLELMLVLMVGRKLSVGFSSSGRTSSGNRADASFNDSMSLYMMNLSEEGVDGGNNNKCRLFWRMYKGVMWFGEF